MSSIPPNSPTTPSFPTTEVVLGSRNQKKCEEIAGLLKPYGIVLRSVADFPEMNDVVEDGDSFTANAHKKVIETATTINRWVIAEDSGLCVHALKGEPGIYSARYAGEPCDDAANNKKLIAALEDVSPPKRTAHYVCHVSLSDPQGNVRLDEEATCSGVIIDDARGSNGFGYDPHFLLPEYRRTFGELGPVVKSRLSHRARAFARFIPKLVRLLRVEGID